VFFLRQFGFSLATKKLATKIYDTYRYIIIPAFNLSHIAQSV